MAYIQEHSCCFRNTTTAEPCLLLGVITYDAAQYHMLKTYLLSARVVPLHVSDVYRGKFGTTCGTVT